MKVKNFPSFTRTHAHSVYTQPGSCRLQQNLAWKGELKQKVLNTTIPMGHANAILHKNTLVFSQNSLVVSIMIYKYQYLGWKADVHMKKVIFTQKTPNFAPKKKKKEESAAQI